jgi:hypothetical protein
MGWGPRGQGEGMKVVVARGVWAALLVSLGLAALGIIPGAAGAAVDLKETEAVCRTAFGDTGPHLRPVADAAPGQVMSVGITWKWDAWSGGQLTEILTCASIDGRLAPELTTRELEPDNDGAATVSLTMPADRVGSVVCGQSLLVGTANGRASTSKATPFCFRIVAGVGTMAAPPAPAAASVPPMAAPAPAAPAASAPAAPAAPAAAPREAAPAAPTPPASEEPKVLGEAVTKGSPPAAAPGTPAEGPAGAGLARTGSTPRSWTAAAGALFVLGGLAVALSAPAVRTRAVSPG